jgi:hypothetical protein
VTGPSNSLAAMLPDYDRKTLFLVDWARRLFSGVKQAAATLREEIRRMFGGRPPVRPA